MEMTGRDEKAVAKSARLVVEVISALSTRLDAPVQVPFSSGGEIGG